MAKTEKKDFKVSNTVRLQVGMSEIEQQFTYQSPSANQIERMRTIRESALGLAKEIEFAVKPCADRTSAIRKLRECVMTANAAIALEDVGAQVNTATLSSPGGRVAS